MPRFFALALVASAFLFPAIFASPAIAADPVPVVVANDAPEKFLPPTTQLYVRWDGVTAHNDAYKKSIWGPVMAGPTGDSFRSLLAMGPKLLGSSVLADPLLEGKSPVELKQNLADLKSAEKVIDLIADKGIIVAAEVREPGPTLKGLGQAFGGLVGGKMPGPEALLPDAQLILIVPNVGDKAEILYGTLRLAMRNFNYPVEPFAANGRKGFRVTPPDRGAPFTVHAAWWVEGKHFVFYIGTRTPQTIMTDMTFHASKGGMTGHPLFQRCIKTGNFETITRGYIDTGSLVGLAKNLAGPFVPGLKERIDGVGLGGLKAVVFVSGFDGKESRALYEFDAPGERQGILKAIKNQPLGLNDLPPMPPDVSRFSALRLDPAATYDAGLSVVDFLTMTVDYGVEEDVAKKGGPAIIKARKDFLKREVNKFLGVSVEDDILPHLGDKLVVFQSPTEGLSLFGMVVCVSLKDPAKIKAATDRMQKALETIANSPVKIRKKMVKGVEIREIYGRGFGILTPSYAIVGDWFVVSAYPQAIQGFILRTKGDLEKWKPDPETAKRLAKMPADGCGIQYCDPKSTASNLCCIGPLFLGLRNSFMENNETDFDPIDVGLVPNAQELTKHLFPNLTITRDNGKTISIEVNESFSLPLEAIGVEPLAFAGLIFGLNF